MPAVSNELGSKRRIINGDMMPQPLAGSASQSEINSKRNDTGRNL